MSRIGNRKIVIPEGVKYMDSTFSECRNMLVASNIPSSVVSLRRVFYGCEKLDSIVTIPTKNKIDIEGMFANCYSLTTLNLSSFDTSSCEAMDGMFNYCTNLTSLTIPFITTSVKTMKDMFKNCRKLVSLDLSTLIL